MQTPSLELTAEQASTFFISHGYIGGGPSLVTAYHLVKSGSVTVYTNCGSHPESILYYNSAQDRDWAILSTNGFTFASWYSQGTGSVGEGVTITPWHTVKQPFSGSIYSMTYNGQYTMAICTQTDPSQSSGSPVQDATQRVLGLSIAIGSPGPGQCPGQQGWHFDIAYNQT
jgi:hypothetical protein